MTIENLEPKRVWKHFYSLTRIPRPSKREQKAVEYMYEWGKSLGLETIKDEVGNIIIRKPATPGMENRTGIIFQAHLDMVPQNNNDVAKEILKVPPPPEDIEDRITRTLQFRIRIPENDPEYLNKVTVRFNGKIILQGFPSM